MTKKKIPLVAIYFAFSAIWDLYMNTYTLKLIGSNTTAVKISFVVGMIAKAYMAFALVRGKRDIHVFIPAVAVTCMSIYGLLTYFSVQNLIYSIAYLILAFIVATAVFPKLEKQRDKAKKFYAIPALLLFGLMFYSFVVIYRMTQLSALVNTLVVPSMYYMLPLWCFGIQDEKKTTRNAERFFFRALAIIIAVVAMLVVAPQMGSSKSNSSSNKKPSEQYDSFADYVKNEDPDLYNDMLDRYNDATGKK